MAVDGSTDFESFSVGDWQVHVHWFRLLSRLWQGMWVGHRTRKRLSYSWLKLLIANMQLLQVALEVWQSVPLATG